MVTWRQLSCGVCGGPRTALDDAMFVACEFCGALYDASAQRWLDPRHQTDAFSRAHAAAFWASTAAGRFARLGAELAASTPTADDPVFLARSEEYHYVYTLVYPDRVTASVTRSAAARVAWAKQAAATDLVVRVDAHVGGLVAAMNDSLRGFGRDAAADEVVAVATRAVAAATRAYAAMQAHPRLVGHYPAPAAHYARMTVRMSLLTMLGTLSDPDVYTRVAVEVFDDQHGIGEECSHCGAPLADVDHSSATLRVAARSGEAGPFDHTTATLRVAARSGEAGPFDRSLERCRHCGSVLERLLDDPWIAARVALFRATLRERHQRDELDTYVTALAAFSFVGAWGRAGADRCALYLRRAMPWLPADALAKAVQLYRTSVADADRTTFDAAIAAITPWTPDATRRPAPPPPPADAFDPEAWLEKSRVYWGYAAPSSDPVMAALSIAITDVLVAQPDAPPPITAALVLRFFDEVLADVPRATWTSRLDIAERGYGDTRAGDLVRAIAAAVRSR